MFDDIKMLKSDKVVWLRSINCLVHISFALRNGAGRFFEKFFQPPVYHQNKGE